MYKFVLWFLTCFVSTLGFSYFYYKITDSCTKMNNKIYVIFFFGVVISTITRYYNFSFINSILFFVFYPILFHYLNPNCKNVIFYILIIWLYAIVLDLISMLLVSLIINFFNLEISIHLFSAIMTFFVFIVIVFMANLNFIKEFTIFINKKLEKMKYFDFIIILYTLIIFLIGIMMFLKLENLSLSFVLSLLLVLIFINLIIFIKYKINNIETMLFVEVIQKNNQFYINMSDEHRIFKHNLIAKLLSIQSISNCKTRILINDLISQFNGNEDFSTHLKNIPYGINGILYQKLHLFVDKINLKFDNEIKQDIFKILKPRRYNVLIEKIMLALDNALEACVKSNAKLLIINLFETTEEIIVEIKNTFANRIDLDKLGNLNYSTKGLKSGLGLYSIMRNKEISTHVKIINDLFIMTLIARKNR